jgi:DNA-directed RNA polymerase subunit K/omega
MSKQSLKKKIIELSSSDNDSERDIPASDKEVDDTHVSDSDSDSDSDSNHLSDSDNAVNSNNVSDDDENDNDDDIDNNAEIDDEDKDIESEESDKESDKESDEESDKEDSDDNCVYKYAPNRSDSEELEDLQETYDDDNQDNQTNQTNQIVSKYVKPEDRITKPRMTKYERVRIIGDRTKQISGGAKPLIKNVEHLSAKEIALLELEHNMIPLIIERPLPNGQKERWYVSELKR